MDDDNLPLLIVGGLVVYLVATGKLAGIIGDGNPNRSASGTPPPPRPRQPGPSTEEQLERGLGATACVGAGIASGMPALGFVAAPVCGTAAVYVAKGVKWGAEKTWAGATWTGEKVGAAAAGVWKITGGNICFGCNSISPEQRQANARIDKPAGFR